MLVTYMPGRGSPNGVALRAEQSKGRVIYFDRRNTMKLGIISDLRNPEHPRFHRPWVQHYSEFLDFIPSSPEHFFCKLSCINILREIFELF